jgi:hypothetical protein
MAYLRAGEIQNSRFKVQGSRFKVQKITPASFNFES